MFSAIGIIPKYFVSDRHGGVAWRLSSFFYNSRHLIKNRRAYIQGDLCGDLKSHRDLIKCAIFLQRAPPGIEPFSEVLTIENYFVDSRRCNNVFCTCCFREFSLNSVLESAE